MLNLSLLQSTSSKQCSRINNGPTTPIAFLTGKGKGKTQSPPTPIKKKLIKRTRRKAERKEKREKKSKARLQGRMKGEDMEQVMMMMISSSDNPSCNDTIPQQHITTTTCPSWKLYDNPFYYSHHHHQQQQQQQQRPQQYQHQHQRQGSKHPRQVNLPALSARKIAASFWDLTFLKPVMDSELDFARAQIIELKAELEFERKARKKAESVSKRLAKEVVEERRAREALERVCEELARETSLYKAEIDRMKKEIEEERKMLRMAEVLREERVQMKLAEAKILFEEKMSEFEETKRPAQPDTTYSSNKNKEDTTPTLLTSSLSGKFARLVFSDKPCQDSSTNINTNTTNADSTSRDQSTRIFALSDKSSSSSYSCYDNVSNNGTVSSSSASASAMAIQQRKTSPETENPHIKRGIKGFVEFPRVVRAIGSKSRHWGSKLECQKAQLRILLKHKNPIRSNSLIIS